MLFLNKVGCFIESLRSKNNMSIRTLAKLSGISHSEVNKIENGQRASPSPIHLKAIAKVFNVNQIHLLKLAEYIDEDVFDLPEDKLLDLNDLTCEEFIQVKSYIKFIRSERNTNKEEQMK